MLRRDQRLAAPAGGGSAFGSGKAGSTGAGAAAFGCLGFFGRMTLWAFGGGPAG